MLNFQVSEVLALVVVMLVQFGALWYRLGRVEQRLKDHCTHDMQREET